MDLEIVILGEVRQKRNSVWFHFYGVYEVVIFIEIDYKLVVAKGCGEREKW